MSEAQATIEVLLVEDSPADARLTREVLKGGNIRNHLTVVTDGVEALSYLRREGRYCDALRPDVVLLDLNLPKMDGREVLKRIRTDPALWSIPVIVLTTSGAEGDVAGAFAERADSYLQKPVDLEAFTRVVEGLVA
jgi:two-component system, chemotaxis family, response regulator Rcp1